MAEVEGAYGAQRGLRVVGTGIGIQDHYRVAHIVQGDREVDRNRSFTHTGLAAGDSYHLAMCWFLHSLDRIRTQMFLDAITFFIFNN